MAQGSLSAGELETALARVGADEGSRDRFVRFLRELERTYPESDVNIREEITGPIVDSLYCRTGVLTRTLASGLRISFVYRSKIHRDFVMADDEHPDHVWEPQTTKLLLALSKNARHVLIGGAYFGDHALLLAQRILPRGGTCHCFEVNAEEIAMLRSNAQANNLDNLVLNPVGLWSEDKARIVVVGDDSHAAPHAVSGEDPSVGFPTTTIDAYVEARGIERLDLLMLDVEGGELPALEGAKRCLGKKGEPGPNLVFEVHRSYVDWDDGLENTDIIRLVEERGYTVFAVRDYQGNVSMKDRPVEIIPVREVYLEGPPHGFNMLAVKDESLVDREGLKRCSGVSPKLLFHRDPKLHQPLH